jgi:cytochrome c553
MRKRPFLLSAALLLAAAAPWPALAQGSTAALISSCESCHGSNGQTRSSETPRLNGQTREYLAARLKDLRNPSNQTISAIHNMLDPVRSIPGAALDAVVAHFVAQAPAQPNHSGADRDRGAVLYAKGRGTQISACASCHGDRGQGIGEAARLAGQHSAYLINQMEALMLTARIQSTMNKHAWALSPEDMRALGAYLGND